ncbi:MAG: isoprenylcysteine carboxylmethyltransferase family protein [Candidatus Thorarchaeota archaeon]
MTVEEYQSPEENYALRSVLVVMNFAVLVPIALSSISYSAELWDFIFIGVGVWLASKFIRNIAAAHEFKQTRMSPQNVDKIVTEGIYARVRHPIAAGAMYMNIAYVFLFRSLTIITVLPVFFALWFVLAKYEENILITRFDKEYKLYMMRTGMLRGRGGGAQQYLAGSGYDSY